MAIEHRDIPDGERHEPKGAGSAPKDYFMVSNGIGGTTWQPRPKESIALTQHLLAQDLTIQSITSNNTPQRVTFGAAQGNSGSPVQLASNGIMTFNKTATYFVTITLNFGLVLSGTGAMFFYVDHTGGDIYDNGLQGVHPSLGDVIPVTTSFWAYLEQGATMTVNMVRDSAGSSTGGLQPFDTTLGSLPVVPSAFIRIFSIHPGV